MQSYIRPVVKPYRLLAILGIRALRANRWRATSFGQPSYRPGSVPVRPVTPWSASSLSISSG